MTVREDLLARTFVELADTLVADFDVVDFLHTLARRSVELLDVGAAGIMLSDQRGHLRVMAASTEQARLLELFELQNNEGPCLDCFRSGRPVAYDDPELMRAAWPTFTVRLHELGFASAQAIPLRLRAETIGALNIFRLVATPLSAEDQAIGQALADVATVGLIQERAITARDVLAEQLHGALNTRVLIEQAKGVVAERAGVEMDVAFALLRTYAREHGRRLGEVATEVVSGRLDDTLQGAIASWRRR